VAQIITNLLGNAIKFTPVGGSIGLDVRLVGEADGVCTVQFTVTDNGIGISKVQQANLFQSFQQAESNTTRKYGGTGLGLSISKNLVEMMGGTIWVESELGKGSSFAFTAKLHRVDLSAGDSEIGGPGAEVGPTGGATSGGAAMGGVAKGVAVEPEDQNYGFAGKCMLLVDDVEINREIVIALLDPTGIKMVSAENGKQAVDLFRAAPESYDIIFMDVMMPEMDGYEATRLIRALGTAAAEDVPIIAMTANVFQEDVEHCLEAGMTAHLGKPLDIDEVLDMIKAYLG